MTKFKMATTALVLAIGGLLASKPLFINPHANAADATHPAPESVTRRTGLAASDPQPTPAVRDDSGGARDEPTLVVETKSKPWETSVRIKIHKSGAIGFGSGTVIKSTPEESLILTCAHIFKFDDDLNPPPERFPHKVTVDLFDGKPHAPGEVQIFDTVAAEVVDYDLDRDVGLLRIRPNRTLAVSPIVPPWWGPQKGMRLMTAGFSEGGPATFWTTKVTNPKVKLFDNSAYHGIECQYAPKQGRSGGGLYTEDGYLAGVSNFAEPRGDRGFYATSESIYHLLARNGLASLYAEEELPTKETRRQTPETSRPSSSSVLSEVELDPLIQIAENQLRNGDHQGARATTDRLNSQLRSQRDALRSKLEHLDSLERRSKELRRAADKNAEPDLDQWGQGMQSNTSPPMIPSRPGSTPTEPGPTPPSPLPDHEQRLRDIERKLDRLLKSPRP